MHFISKSTETWPTLVFATVAALIGFASDARADRVVLRNGDTLTGKIASVSKSGVELDTELAGHVTLKWTALSRLTGATPVRVKLSTDETVEGTIAVADGRVSIEKTTGAPVAVDVDSLKTFDVASTGPRAATWHGAVNSGLDFSRGNAPTATISTNAVITRLGAVDKLGLFGTYLFSSINSGADRVTTARATRGGARYDHDIAGPAFGFGFGDIENDPYQLLDLRTVAGGGAGLHVVRTGDTQLNLFGGLSYDHDSYINATTDTTTTGTTTTPPAPTQTGNGKPVTPPGQSGSTPGNSGSAPGQQKRSGTPPSVVRTSLTRSVAEYLAGQDLFHQLSDSISVNEGVRFFAATNDWQDYRISFDLTFSAQLNGWLQWNLTLADRYLNIPPAGGAVQNDTFVTTGLGISFGRGDAGGYTGSDGRPASGPRR